MSASQKVKPLTGISRREQRAIEAHHARLCQAGHPDISLEEAVQDWLKHYAQKWRIADHLLAMAMQRQEMAEHKWIRSQQAGYDLGSEALTEWIHLYAALWRDWYETEFELSDYYPSDS